MPTYLDAAVVRIQPYLARTPELSLRRGASWMIVKATGKNAVEAWIRDNGLGEVSPHDEAGHADGVVNLTVPEGTAEHHARQLLLHLRKEIPGAHLQAGWGQADSYLEFRNGQSREDQGLRALPLVADFPLAETCGSCRTDPGDPASKMCTDCRARAAAGGHRRARPAPTGSQAPDDAPDALGTERMVIDAVGHALGRRLRPVGDMSELASLGDESGNRNHVATIALDGNGMGSFFAALAGQPDATLKQQISPEISAATRSALISAAQAITRESDRCLPVIPHVLGGDDVVVSAVADRAWPFTRAFLTRFAEALDAAAGRLELPGPLRQRLPSMSAGLVFAHAKFPYARAVQLADAVLHRAKKDTRGAESAIGWLDVTADGEAQPDWRTTQTLGGLQQQAEAIAALAAIPRSGRQALARLLARGTDEESCAAALYWARRNGHPVVASLLGQASVTDVRNLVALTRWWRA